MLSRRYKLKRNNDFKKVFKQGQYYQKDYIKLKVLANNLKISRFAFVIGLKISKKAVERNKIRRQLEEITRYKFDKIKTGFDVVIMPNSEIIDKSYKRIGKILISLFQKSKILWDL